MRKRDLTKHFKSFNEKNTYEMAIELYTKHNYKLFQYQGYDNLLINQELISDRKGKYEPKLAKHLKYSTEDFEEFKSGEWDFCPVIGWNGGMYTPPAFRESFQLSIWKIEPYGTVKIVNKYFTPKNQRATDFDFPGFTLQLSMDEQTMLMVEKDHEKHKELLVVSFDMYSLEILNEMLVSVVDESIRNEPYYQGIESEDNMNYKGPYQINSNMSKIASWNFGTYLICGVSTSCKSKIIYKFVVYNLKTSSYICTIDRNKHKYLKDKVISIAWEVDREEILHFSVLHKNDLIMLEINSTTSHTTPIIKYSGFNVIYALPTESKRFMYIIHKDSKTKQYSLYWLLYRYEFEENIKDLEGILSIKGNFKYINHTICYR